MRIRAVAIGQAICRRRRSTDSLTLHFRGHRVKSGQRGTEKTQWELVVHVVIVVVTSGVSGMVGIVQSQWVHSMMVLELCPLAAEILGTVVVLALRRWTGGFAGLAWILRSAAPLAQGIRLGTVHTRTGIVFVSRRWRGVRMESGGGGWRCRRWRVRILETSAMCRL